MDLDIGRTRDLFQIQARGGESPQRVERPALQQFGQCALQGNLETRVGTKAGEATLVLRVQQGDVHHRVLAAQRGVLDQDAEARRAQRRDAGRNARVAGDHGFGHVGQADAFADDAALDVSLENFRQGLRARLVRGVAGRHAIAHIQVADDVDREIRDDAIALAHVGNGADAPLGVAGVELDQAAGVHAALGVVELVQLGVQQIDRPAAVLARLEPALLRVVHMRPVGHLGAEVVVGPEVIGRKALEKLAQGAGQAGQAGGALAVGEQQRTIAVADVDRPDAVHRVQPGFFFDVKAEGLQFALQGVDGGFERGVFAGDEGFGVHGPA